MVLSPSLQCCSPRRPLLMLSLACRLDTHAVVAVRRRTSLLDLADLGALGPAPCACAHSLDSLPFRVWATLGGKRRIVFVVITEKKRRKEER